MEELSHNQITVFLRMLLVHDLDINHCNDLTSLDVNCSIGPTIYELSTILSGKRATQVEEFFCRHRKAILEVLKGERKFLIIDTY